MTDAAAGYAHGEKDLGSMSRTLGTSEWNIPVGDVRPRASVHAEYGGGGQGGMEPSGRTPNVLIFTGEGGDQHGYIFDGWHEDGTFHYTGEGPVGPQVMSNGNRAVRDHALEGRALRLFAKQGARSPNVMYLGQFELPEEEPYRVDDARDDNGDLRSVFVFRLRPVGAVTRGRTPDAPESAGVTDVPLEAANVELYLSERSNESEVFLRTEAKLVHRYALWLQKSRKSAAYRNRIPTPGGSAMWTDLFDPSRSLLVEAKGTATRNDIRTALGQLLDYARYVRHESLGVLLPAEPPADLLELLHSCSVAVIWPEVSRGFVESWPQPQSSQ